MRHFSGFFLLLLMLASSHQASARARWTTAPHWAAHFQKAGVQGSFLLYDLRRSRYTVFNRKRAQTRFSPASSFKIFNALAALEAGAVRDEKEILKWDGADRGVPAWNRAHSLASAFPTSTVWFYREMAQRVGEKRMANWLRESRYGNRAIGGGIDRFWLDGELRISAEEQILFLTRFHQNQLPFSRRNSEIVKRIMVQERGKSWVLHAKSGWVGFNPTGELRSVTPQIGWNIGFVERGTDTYFFALNIEMNRPEAAAARGAITRAILTEMKLLDPLT